jgi:hypothetical protein
MRPWVLAASIALGLAGLACKSDSSGLDRGDAASGPVEEGSSGSSVPAAGAGDVEPEGDAGPEVGDDAGVAPGQPGDCERAQQAALACFDRQRGAAGELGGVVCHGRLAQVAVSCVAEACDLALVSGLSCVGAVTAELRCSELLVRASRPGGESVRGEFATCVTELAAAATACGQLCRGP